MLLWLVVNAILLHAWQVVLLVDVNADHLVKAVKVSCRLAFRSQLWVALHTRLP